MITQFYKREEAGYPALLKEITLAPLGIYIKGQWPPRERAAVAIVGTRRATAAGRVLAGKLAAGLSRQKITVVSGLALGIDAAAHEGAIEAGGISWAVLANGLDQIYPRQNYRLAEKIIDLGGALISEYPAGTPSLPHHFLARNRIVSGLSRGTVIIEAPLNSGALVTARFTLEQNRELMVIPGPVNHPNYAGSHRLIKMGAALVTSVDDILENLSLEKVASRPLVASGVDGGLDELETKIVEAIKSAGAPVTIDTLGELSKLDPQTLNRALTLLVINDIIKESGGGKYSL